mgnify:CR=1 FL=1
MDAPSMILSSGNRWNLEHRINICLELAIFQTLYEDNESCVMT